MMNMYVDAGINVEAPNDWDAVEKGLAPSSELDTLPSALISSLLTPRTSSHPAHFRQADRSFESPGFSALPLSSSPTNSSRRADQVNSPVQSEYVSGMQKDIERAVQAAESR